MWQIKYNSGYSAFFEDQSCTQYFRKKYDVYVDGIIYHKQLSAPVFSIHTIKNETVTVKIVSEELEYESEVCFADDNYYLDISKYISKDDLADDITMKLQALILSVPDNTTIFFPQATYKITSLFLRSNIKLLFDEQVEFDVSVKRTDFPVLADIVEDKQFRKKAVVSSWEGNPQTAFASIITGYNLENIELIGKAKIKGNASDLNWWNEPKQKNIAWRPKTIFLNNCQNVIIHGLEIYDSPSWTLHPFFSNNLKFLDIYINNPKVSPNTDGINPESCSDVEINGCVFDLGDDCIAIKSGKIYMADNFHKPSQNIKIINCKMEHGHGAIVLGSEISSGVKHLEIRNCYFNDTDRGLRVKTRRGRGHKSIIDDVTFTNITMENVRAPITINSYYNCDPDGNSDYVASRECIASELDTPVLGSFKFENLHCDNIHEVICMAYGLPERAISSIEISNSQFSFGCNSVKGYPLMMREALPEQNTMFNLLNVDNFVLVGNKFESCDQQSIKCQGVKNYVRENNEYS